MKLTEKWVQEVIDRHVENVELVALEDVGNRRHRVVRLFIDHPAGVSHDLCARVSGFMGAALDEAGSFDGPYTLEVSSPGLERPLTKPAHFPAQVGREGQRCAPRLPSRDARSGGECCARRGTGRSRWPTAEQRS